MNTTVAPREKFELLSVLPNSFPIDDSAIARGIEPGDSEELAKIIVSNPDVSKYVTWASMVSSPEDVVPAIQSRSNNEMAGRYAIVHHRPIVGYIGIFPGKKDDEYGMGYFLDKAERGRGLAGRVLVALMSVAKNALSPKHLYLQIDPNNTASVAMATKYGFQPAETLWDPDLKLNEQRYRMELE